MFDDSQIQSYKSINAPADLRQKVITACEESQKVSKFPVRKTIYGLAPVAACMFLMIMVLMPRTFEPLMLRAGNTTLGSESVTLSPVAEALVGNVPEPAAYGVRMASLEPVQYTVTLTGNQELEVTHADGFAAVTEDGSICWTVTVPNEDMVYKLTLLAEGEAYEVLLRYDVQSGSYSMQYEAK